MKQAWLEACARHPVKALLVGLMLVVVATIGAKNLYFNGDYKVYFEKDNPQRVNFEQMQADFTKNETANIVIAPTSGNVFSEDTLTLVSRLTELLWQTPYSTRVDSITNFQHTFAEDDDLIVEDLLFDEGMLDPEKVATIQRVAMSEPNLKDRLVSNQGHVTQIVVTVNLPDGDKTQEIVEVANYVREATKGLAASFPEHAFYFTGIVYMNDAFAGEAKKDSETLVPGMFLVILLVLWVLLRSALATVATMLIIVFAIAATMGLGGWLGFFLSTATVNVPTLVMTLAVADCVHIIASMTFAMRHGESKEQAIFHSLQLNFMPILITSVTTAIGFLTLNFANVPALRDLGNMTAMGIMLAFVFSVTLLPALLMLLPIKVRQVEEGDSDVMVRFADWVIAKQTIILPITAIAIVAAVYASSVNQVNDIATDYFDDSSEFRRSTDFQTENLSGMSTLDFALATGTESGINNPTVLQHVEAFSVWLEQQPEVDHVSTITDTFRRLNKNMHGDQQDYYVLPEQQELAAQYLLLYEMSLPYGLDLNNQLDINKSATRLMVTLQNLGSKEFTEFESRALNWVTENAPELTVTSGSPNLMFAHIGETNMQSMLRGTFLALVLISGLLIVALRSWKLGVISLIPNILPAVIGFGIWGVYSGQINMGLSVVLSMSLGIIVDDTVHFLSKYKYARETGKLTDEAIRYAFSSVGRALWITTLVLTLGFGVLTLSSFALNADMGMLTAVIILAALIVDFLVLPAILLVFDKHNHEKESEYVSDTPHNV